MTPAEGMETAMTTDAAGRPAQPPLTGYAQVNGLEMYYEVHSAGRPLVLLHGGMMTIDLAFGGMLPGLTAGRQVIATELQGHGRTADIDRELLPVHLAGDVAALLSRLGIDRADLFGFSLGGLVALQFAMSYPDRVSRLVLAATHYRADGYHAEIRDPGQHPGSARMPTESDFRQMQEAYARTAPDPGNFGPFLAKASAAVGAFEGWSDDDLRAVTAPTLLIVGDTDFVRLEHAVRMRELIPDCQLAVLPGTTHVGLMRRADLVVPMVESFLRPPD
jgi:pimeloyl-ACP methyl ester carboxylesterase